VDEHDKRATNALVLGATWRDWAARLAALAPTDWSRPTRCDGWTVHALAAHVAPDVTQLTALPDSLIDGPAAVDDAADLLQGFNRPDGVAHTMAGAVADMAVAGAGSLGRDEVIDRFERSAAFAETSSVDQAAVIPHPVVGSITVAVATDLSVVEATVHLLDLIDAVGGPAPSPASLAFTRSVLVRVADPVALIDAATGRRSPDGLFPLMR
jgi:uncharacterized protein (TIGR03083 family)